MGPHFHTGVGAKEYCDEVEHKVNNSILYAENGNWKFPVSSGTLSAVSLSDTSAKTFARNTCVFFDVIFRHHEDDSLMSLFFYECVITLYQDMMAKLRKRSNMSASNIISI